MESSFLTRDEVLKLWSGITDSKILDEQSTNPMEHQIVRTHTHRGDHGNTGPGISQPSVAPCAGRLTWTINKTKIQTQSSADRSTTSLSLAHQRKKKQTNKQTKHLSTNLTLQEAYTNHWTKPRRAEAKRKKEFNLEAWEKETSNTISLKMIIMKGWEIVHKWRNKLETHNSK